MAGTFSPFRYTSKDYRDALLEAGFEVSMSHRGDCYDNAPVESFFATLKKELVAGEVFYSRTQANREMVDYIEGFYNFGAAIPRSGTSVPWPSRNKRHDRGALGFP